MIIISALVWVNFLQLLYYVRSIIRVSESIDVIQDMSHHVAVITALEEFENRQCYGFMPLTPAYLRARLQ